MKGHPSYQENCGGWEAAPSYLRAEGLSRASLPIDDLNGNVSARLALRDTGHQRTLATQSRAAKLPAQ